MDVMAGTDPSVWVPSGRCRFRQLGEVCGGAARVHGVWIATYGHWHPKFQALFPMPCQLNGHSSARLRC
jgi:hypothetical protein